MECPSKKGQAAEFIVAYVARTLDAGTAADFQRHLAACAACRELTARQAAVWSALDEWQPAPVSPGFDEQLLHRLAQPAVVLASRIAAGGGLCGSGDCVSFEGLGSPRAGSRCRPAERTHRAAGRARLGRHGHAAAAGRRKRQPQVLEELGRCCVAVRFWRWGR